MSFACSLKMPYLYIVENTSKCAPMATMTSALGAARLALAKPLRPSGPSASGCVDGNASGEYCSTATGMPVPVGEFFHRGNGVFLHHAAADHEQRALGFGDQRPCGVELRRIAYRQHGVAIGGGRDGFGAIVCWSSTSLGGLDVRRALRFGQRDAEGLAHRFLHLARHTGML